MFHICRRGLSIWDGIRNWLLSASPSNWESGPWLRVVAKDQKSRHSLKEIQFDKFAETQFKIQKSSLCRVANNRKCCCSRLQGYVWITRLNCTSSAWWSGLAQITIQRHCVDPPKSYIIMFTCNCRFGGLICLLQLMLTFNTYIDFKIRQ